MAVRAILSTPHCRPQSSSHQSRRAFLRIRTSPRTVAMASCKPSNRVMTGTEIITIPAVRRAVSPMSPRVVTDKYKKERSVMTAIQETAMAVTISASTTREGVAIPLCRRPWVSSVTMRTRTTETTVITAVSGSRLRDVAMRFWIFQRNSVTRVRARIPTPPTHGVAQTAHGNAVVTESSMTSSKSVTTATISIATAVPLFVSSNTAALRLRGTLALLPATHPET